MSDPRPQSPHGAQTINPRWNESAWASYALAVAAVAAAALLTAALRLAASAQNARVIFAFFYVAVFVAVWFGGRGPGLFSVALSVAVADLFFLPSGLLAPDLSGLLPNVFFFVISLLAVFLIERSRRAEAGARASRESLETTLRSIGDAVISTDAAGRVEFMNAVAERLTGWPLAEARGRPLAEVFLIVNEETRAAVESPVEKVLREGKVVGLANHTVLLARGGAEVPIDDSGAPIRDERGHTAGVVLVFHDISERRKAERERATLAAIVESSDDVILSKTLDGVVTSWNRAAERVYGYAAEEAVGQHVSIVVPPELSGELSEIIARLRRGERVEHLETVRVRKDGQRLDVSVTVSPIRDPSGRLVGASTIARDITERKQAEEALRESEARFQTLVELSPDAIVVHAEGRVVFINTSGAKLLRATDPARVVGRPITDFLHPDFHEIVRGRLQKMAAGERVAPIEMKFIRLDGTEVFGEVVSVPMLYQNGPAVQVVVRDITERRRVEEERARLLEREQEARRQAEEVNRTKDEFLATLSHELRTPLTPIIGWANMIRSGQLGAAEAGQGLRVIEKNSHALSRLINDLLDMSSILSGKLRIERAPVELGAVVREAVETVRTQAAARSVTLEVETGGLAPAVVSGDRTRLVQIFWNLLNNAVKFSREGGRVRVSVGASGGSARVRVEDEGEGIAPEFLPHIFERFRQADMGTTRQHGGLGIGLALVKSLVGAHGGRVEASSGGAGRGSSFTVTLPAAHVAAESRASGELNPEDAKPCAEELCRVLLVEDARDTLEMLRVAFAARGYVATACESPEEALRVAESAPFDIIVSDIGLPRIDGYELLERLRRLPHLRGVPALALTGYAGPKDAEAALAAGFDAHVPKPVDPSALAEQVGRLLKRKPGNF
jgi:PAS domain S-box-containing protein